MFIFSELPFSIPRQESAELLESHSLKCNQEGKEVKRSNLLTSPKPYGLIINWEHKSTP